MASRPTSRSRQPRDVMGFGLAALNRLAGTAVLDRLKLRSAAERAVFGASRSGFRAAGAANRTFASVTRRGAPERPTTASNRALFDLTPTDEQQQIADATRQFAAEQLRPAASAADVACAAPADLLARAASELGMSQLSVPEALGGMGGERSATTGVLVNQALAHGDMGLAVACLAPAAVSTALTLWGDAAQQATYLPAFVGDASPAAALCVLEPHVLFDPSALRTTARRDGGVLVLDGVKSLVPRAGETELFVVAATLDGSPALILLESGTAGVSVQAEPAMGLRAAALGRLTLESVRVPASAVLAGGAGSGADPTTSGDAATVSYTECIRLARLGWAALALGTGKAVLDYVIPYVNDRTAFGEPISHRQAVAFAVADIATELEGARLTTLRAASRAEQGLPFARETALARRLSGEYGMRIGSAGVQLLGGHGYVTEHPVERWYRDLRAVSLMEGVVLV